MDNKFSAESDSGVHGENNFEYSNRLKITQALIRSFSNYGSKQVFLDNVVRLIQVESSCRFVGIRILDENG